MSGELDVETSPALAMASSDREMNIMINLLSQHPDPSIGSSAMHFRQALESFMGNRQSVPLYVGRNMTRLLLLWGVFKPDRVVLEAAVDGDLPFIRELVDEFDASPAAVEPVNGLTLLHFSVHRRNMELLDFLLNRICSLPDSSDMLNARTTDANLSAAHIAAQNADLEVMSKLHAAGVDCITAADSQGTLPIHCAAQKGATALVDYLLLLGAPINAANSIGLTSLHMAVFGKHVILVNSLLRQGADSLIGDATQMLPLHVAAHSGDVTCAMRLLHCDGGSVAAVSKDANGATPAAVARQRMHLPLAQAIESFVLRDQFKWTRFLNRYSFLRVDAKYTNYLPFAWFAVFLHLTVLQYFFNLVPFYAGTWSSVQNLFMLFAFVAILLFWMVVLGDPGFEPLPIAPPIASSLSTSTIVQADLPACELDWTYADHLRAGKSHLICVTCKIVKAPRVKHCKDCNRCIARHDHHCPYVLNCVGAGNHRAFTLMLAFIGFSSFLHLVMTLNYLFVNRSISAADALRSFVFALNDLFGLLFVSVLLHSTAHSIWQNLTANEQMNAHRYGYLMNAEGEFTNPFDQGGNRNCLTFWGCARAAAMRDMSLTLKPPTAHQLFKHDIRARLEAQSGDEATSLRESSNATNHCTRWIEQRCAACSRHSHSHSHHGGSCSHGHSHGVSPAPAPETVVVHDEKVEDDTCGPNENELLLSPVDKRRD